jgi:hypothetical protein
MTIIDVLGARNAFQILGTVPRYLLANCIDHSIMYASLPSIV